MIMRSRILAVFVLGLAFAAGPSLFGQVPSGARHRIPEKERAQGLHRLRIVRSRIHQDRDHLRELRPRPERSRGPCPDHHPGHGRRGTRIYDRASPGQNDFAGLDDTVTYFSNNTDTEEEVRRGLVKTLKMGLMSYVSRRPIAARIAIELRRRADRRGPGRQLEGLGLQRRGRRALQRRGIHVLPFVRLQFLGQQDHLRDQAPARPLGQLPAEQLHLRRASRTTAPRNRTARTACS